MVSSTLWASMQDRFRMYLDRLLLLCQRLRRDKTFSKPALADADMEQNAAYCQVYQQSPPDNLHDTVPDYFPKHPWMHAMWYGAQLPFLF